MDPGEEAAAEREGASVAPRPPRQFETACCGAIPVGAPGEEGINVTHP